MSSSVAVQHTDWTLTVVRLVNVLMTSTLLVSVAVQHTDWTLTVVRLVNVLMTSTLLVSVAVQHTDWTVTVVRLVNVLTVIVCCQMTAVVSRPVSRIAEVDQDYLQC